MTSTITKSDYLKYLECPAYFWFHKKKPAILTKKPLSDFDKELIHSGQEVELWARKLFSGGKLVESRQEEALTDTQKLLELDAKVIFQATFQADGLYVMVDILEWDEANQYWIINEAKGSTADGDGNAKKSHINDAAFQKIVLQRAGYLVGKVNLIELNKEFIKDGEIIPQKLLQKTNITADAQAKSEEIDEQIKDMQRLMEKEAEPHSCKCEYKSRPNHCPAFKHLYPTIPDYSIYDLARIKKNRLEGLVETDCYAVNDIPGDYALTQIQRNQVDCYQKDNPINKSILIQKELDVMEYPFYYLDYETCPAAVPIYDGCRPYMHIPFQYSLHVQRGYGHDFEHYEYIHTDGSTNPMRSLAEKLSKELGTSGSIITWNKSFEGGRNRDIGIVFPEFAEVFEAFNERLYDLADVFSKNLYVHKDFRGKYSIKYVTPVMAPELSYKELGVQNGAMALVAWQKMVFGDISDSERQKIKQDLLEYCKLDTWAMVRIYEELLKVI